MNVFNTVSLEDLKKQLKISPMQVFRSLHTLHGLLVFGVIFLLLLPIFLIIIPFKGLHVMAYRLNRLWAWLLFAGMFMPPIVKVKGTLNKNRQYVLCANHFSHADIPTLGLVPVNFIFVGKASLSKIPVFGFMFSKLHITVDRSNMRDRYAAMERSMAAVDRGLSLAIFPEGGIVTPNPPQMVKFKDGAFRVAIEKQVPILPVTIPHNWQILPDHKQLRVHWKRPLVIVHEPIETKGLTLDDMKALKAKVYDTIDAELKTYHP